MVKSENYRKLKMLDLAILLHHVHLATLDQEIGFADARESLETLTNKLNKTVMVESTALESALWSANLLDEKSKFWHPHGLTFEQWVKSVVGSDGYNRYYCLIGKKHD